ncbi:MAG: hypothetical protein PUA62_01630, partial [Lachnospiraceae bacterium]|nr:hypothetical protein [Lachnospiraceae bacterium]
MKRKRTWAGILCAYMVLCMLFGNSGTVYANDATTENGMNMETASDTDAYMNNAQSEQGQTVTTQQDVKQEENECVDEELPDAVGKINLIHVNPLYEDFYSEQAQNAYWADGFGTVSDNASIYATENYLSYAQTVSNIRQAMVRRETAVTVNMQMEGI